MVPHTIELWFIKRMKLLPSFEADTGYNNKTPNGVSRPIKELMNFINPAGIALFIDNVLD